MMEPKHLVYLATIIDKGSITAAADYLSVAQPTLTRAMATLEMQAGRQLFRRSRFGVQCTDMGEALAREGRDIIRTMELAREQVSRYQLGVHKELRIATGPLLGMGIMAEAVSLLNERYPSLGLDISVMRPSESIEQLLDDRTDVVIAPDPYGREVAGFHKEMVVRDTIGVFCDKSHPLTCKTDLGIADLAAAQWLSMGLASVFETQVLEMLLAIGVSRMKTQVIFRNDSAILLKLLSGGRHLAVLPRAPVYAIPHLANLVELKIDLGKPVERNIYLWTRQKMADAEVVSNLRDLVRQCASKYLID